MESNVLDLLKRQLEDEKKTIHSVLADGAAKDYADYKFLCGKLLGLSTGQFLIDTVIERYKKLDE
jgi:hypothetical protein